MQAITLNPVQCAACSAQSGELQPLVCELSRPLGLVCEKCRLAGLAHFEVLFVAFGGRHGGRGEEPIAPYHFPVLRSPEALRDVALRTVKKNPYLMRFLVEEDAMALEAEDACG